LSDVAGLIGKPTVATLFPGGFHAFPDNTLASFAAAAIALIAATLVPTEASTRWRGRGWGWGGAAIGLGLELGLSAAYPYYRRPYYGYGYGPGYG